LKNSATSPIFSRTSYQKVEVNPSTGEAEAGGWKRIRGNPGLYNEILKKKKVEVNV
jgi:hypothetical protein